MRIIKKHIKYIIVFVMLLIIEIFIGIFMHKGFIRDYGGDMLILPLLYAFTRIFLVEDSKTTRLYLPLGLFLFGVCVELLQAVDLIDILEIGRNSTLGIIIGSTCDWKDILCYLAGTVLILCYNYKNLLKRITY